MVNKQTFREKYIKRFGCNVWKHDKDNNSFVSILEEVWDFFSTEIDSIRNESYNEGFEAGVNRGDLLKYAEWLDKVDGVQLMRRPENSVEAYLEELKNEH